jgi:hypothetical protein
MHIYEYGFGSTSASYVQQPQQSCVCIHVRQYMYVYIHIHIHMYACMYVCMYVYYYIYTSVLIHPRTHAFASVVIRAHRQQLTPGMSRFQALCVVKPNNMELPSPNQTPLEIECDSGISAMVKKAGSATLVSAHSI